MENSKILWTDHTFNPWIGCAKVSEGCAHCYAETLTKRFGKDVWGRDAARVRTSAAMWKRPLAWNGRTWLECPLCGWRGSTGKRGCDCITPYEEATQRVFCASMADVFEDNPQVSGWRGELFRLIERTPNLNWLLLTKRHEYMADEIFDLWLENVKNVWLGVSVENQRQADKRLESFARVGSALRFLSIEPMLEAITIPHIEKFDWVIVGGESGVGARPFDWDWARDVREQCRRYDVKFFMKQGGGVRNKREQIADIPEDLRVREFPRR